MQYMTDTLEDVSNTLAVCRHLKKLMDCHHISITVHNKNMFSCALNSNFGPMLEIEITPRIESIRKILFYF